MTASTRRGFLIAGLGLLAGCVKHSAVTPMPGPPWPADTSPPQVQEATASAAPTPAWREQIMPRAAWAQGSPEPSRMNRMAPVHYVTLHHDGMEPFYGSDLESVSAHIELIRRLHRRRGWGDIGYHYAIDRAGRVWEGRSLIYQGAHVKDHNPGNIGVVVLGNFDEQMPTVAQLNAVERHLGVLMRAYGVTVDRLHTHQEWQGAATACPGTRLQEYLKALRRTGKLG